MGEDGGIFASSEGLHVKVAPAHDVLELLFLPRLIDVTSNTESVDSDPDRAEFLEGSGHERG